VEYSVLKRSYQQHRFPNLAKNARVGYPPIVPALFSAKVELRWSILQSMAGGMLLGNNWQAAGGIQLIQLCYESRKTVQVVLDSDQIA
jgi:hypothetical protein